MLPPLIGLVGAKRSGKDTFAEALVAELDFRRVAFADRLKEAALRLDPTIDVRSNGYRVGLAETVLGVGWEEAKELPEVRRILQNLGVSLRDVIAPDVWVRAAMDEAARARFAGTPVVVTDVRFPNEVDAILTAGGVIVKVTRAGLVPDDPHPSEALAWSPTLVPWAIVENDSDVAQLQRTAIGIGRFLGVHPKTVTP